MLIHSKHVISAACISYIPAHIPADIIVEQLSAVIVNRCSAATHKAVKTRRLDLIRDIAVNPAGVDEHQMSVGSCLRQCTPCAVREVSPSILGYKRSIYIKEQYLSVCAFHILYPSCHIFTGTCIITTRACIFCTHYIFT